MDGEGLECNFLSQLETPRGFEVLFDYLPDVHFFVKDAEGRFVACNNAFLGLLQVKRKQDVIGHQDREFFPRNLSENYVTDDRAVLTSAIPLVDKIELVPNSDGSVDWYSTTKLPVFDRDRKVIAIAGITRDVRKMKSSSEHFLSMAPALEAMVSDYAEDLSVAELAAKVSLSVSQFDRQFKRKFQTTPLKYLTKIRIDAACHLLASTDLSIADIAVRSGFYDQSHFTHQFVRYKGTTPSSYRKKFATA